MQIRRWLLPLGAILLMVAVVSLMRSPSLRRDRQEPASPPALADLSDAERRERLRQHIRRELGDSYDAPLPIATEKDVVRGAELWALLCAGCHAGDARGRRTLSRMLPVPPGDLTDPERAVFYSDRAKLWVLCEGSEGTPMFGWEDILSESDRYAVLAFLKTLTGGE